MADSLLTAPEQALAYAGKTVAITGASGYLASALCEALSATRARIVLVSRRDLAPLPGVETAKMDVRDADGWGDLVARADIVFHLAGNTSVYAAAQDPAESLRSTVLPVTHLVAAARLARRRPRVLFASTATVYGLTGRMPVAEDTPLNPATTYDLHKVFAEQQLALASRQGLLEATSLRLANVYGPSANVSSASDRGVLNKVVRLAVGARVVTLYGTGEYVRDYVYIDDVVRAFLAAAVQPGLAGMAFNVASGRGVTVREAFSLVVDRAERATGQRSRIVTVPWPDDATPIEFRNYVADIRRLAGACGWAPTVSLQDGIDCLIGRTVNGDACYVQGV